MIVVAIILIGAFAIPRKIQVSMETLNAFENEMKLATEDPSRILKNVTNKGVRLMLENPGCEIEIIDTSTKKVIGTVAAGLGGTGIAAVAAGGFAMAAAGGAAAGGGAAFFFAAAPVAAAPDLLKVIEAIDPSAPILATV